MTTPVTDRSPDWDTCSGVSLERSARPRVMARVSVAILGLGWLACASASSSGTTGSGGTSSTGGAASGGSTAAASGGSLGTRSGGSNGTASGGASGTAGRSASGGSPGAGGAHSTGGADVDAGAGDVPVSGAACTMGPWPAADPAMPGPFTTVTESNVGPEAGVGADGGAAPQFTLFRPKDLSQGGLCHPVVTWGNGTGTTPSLYKSLLDRLASHGFVVIASNSSNVAQGTPAPMVAGVTWVLQQNDDPTSEMYQRIDTLHVGASGHSQGAFATTSAGADGRITTIAPICGAMAQRNLHGPAALFCGGMDTTVPCDGSVQSAFNGISNQPVMLASYLAVDHSSWISFRGTTLSPMEVAVVAWMRVQLMDDKDLRPWFYGASCKLCQDPGWKIMQKMMDL
jgi:hypothetical protein